MQKNLPGDRYLAATTERQHAMGTGTWQQQPSANGCQVPVPFYVAFQIIGSFLFLINAVNQLLTLL